MKTLTTLVLLCTASYLNAAILAGPITNAANGHVYYLLTASPLANKWIAAEAEAVSLGGHLATINDAAEHQWVYTNFNYYGGVARHLMIGLTDSDVEGSFHWVSGETSTYRNWAAPFPDNDAADADYVVIFKPGGANAGKWNDYRGLDSAANGVVEVIPGVASQVTIRPAVEISWTSQTTNTYQVQWSSAIESNNWINLGPAIPGNGSTNRVFDSPSDKEKKFYRVVTLP